MPKTQLNIKESKLNALEKYEVYKAVKSTPHNILNEKLNFKSNTLCDRVTEWQSKDKKQTDDKRCHQAHNNQPIKPNMITSWCIKHTYVIGFLCEL